MRCAEPLFYLALYYLKEHSWKLKIGISDAGTPQPDRDLDAETLLVKLQLDACNS